MFGDKKGIGERLAHVFLMACLIVPIKAVGDENYPEQRIPAAAASQTMQDVAKVGSAAGFDNRLPPVIPGENIQHNGRTMKVWSSAGPVPVGQVAAPPSIPQAPGQQGAAVPNVGVIVDQRSRPDSNR